MTKNRRLILPAVILGIVLIVIAIIYWVSTASSLPSFFPGHQAGSSTHHFKHGLGAFLLGIACFVFAWFRAGPAGGAAVSQGPPPGRLPSTSSAVSPRSTTVGAIMLGSRRPGGWRWKPSGLRSCSPSMLLR